jgi:hypothetical protein
LENSLHLKVEIVTMDTQQLISFMTLLDCKATGFFIDQGFVDQNRITTRTLSCPIPVYNIDGTLNETGSIREVVDVVLRYKDHFEWVQFTETGLEKQDVILGYMSTIQRLTELPRRLKCHAVQVAAVPAGRRLNRNVTNARQKPATYVRAALDPCLL